MQWYAFRTAMSFRFFDWLTNNRDVFTSHRESLGYIWAEDEKCKLRQKSYIISLFAIKD